MMREGEMVFSREEHTTWFYNTKWAAWKHTSNIIQAKKAILGNEYEYTYAYVHAITTKLEVINLKREQWGENGRI